MSHESYGKRNYLLFVVKEFYMRSNLNFFPMKFTLQIFYGIIFYRIWSYESNNFHRKISIGSNEKNMREVKQNEALIWPTKIFSSPSRLRKVQASVLKGNDRLWISKAAMKNALHLTKPHWKFKETLYAHFPIWIWFCWCKQRERLYETSHRW
jgi:hypothetical protein